uniref:Glycoside hydrolase family 5 n=1 Tax=uncultured bacterium contig00037 TaxID=1181525 RepID=A0A806KMT4_9BACT|nr:glycoside hydrolase family 5 [uncultured bacterium contig00037]
MRFIYLRICREIFMKKKFLLGLLAIILVFGTAVVGCNDGSTDNNGNGNGNGNGSDPRPASPESMSTKTAMQYFTDEGITVGINVGNSLDSVDTWTPPYSPSNPISSETAWGSPLLNQAYFNGLANLGLKIVRIPVTWMGHIGSAPNYTVDEAWLKRVAEVVNMAHNAGLKAFINIHHDGNYSHGWDGWLNITRIPTDSSIADKFEKVWTQIAEYFKNYGDYLMFQGFNELHNGDWGASGGSAQEYQILNNLNQRFTNAVRGTGGNNAARYLLYYGYCTVPMIGTDTKFVLPIDSANGTTKQVVGFHYYEPFDFAHNGEVNTWDTPAFRNSLETYFSAFKTRFTDNGIPVIIGENGPCENKAGNATAHQNRLLFIDYMYGKARENGIVPIYWETGDHTYVATLGGNANFNLINRNTGQPRNQQSREVLERMVTAVNNASPPIPGTGTAAVWESYNPNIDSNGSTAALTLASNQYIFSGSLSAVEGSYAQANFVPNAATLTAMRAMTTFSFKVTGDGKQYEVMLPTTESIVSYNHYRYRFTAPAAETTITVNVPANLSQADWGGEGVVTFIKNNIQNIQFQPVVTGTFNLKVWDIRTYQ